MKNPPAFVDRDAARAIRLLLLARGIRDFGDGFAAVLLPAYLGALGLSAFKIGVVATAALLGSAVLTLAIGLLGTRFDQRPLLIAAALLMTLTGLAFALVNDFAVLLIVAFVGTLNPSSGSVSIFVPIEHALLAREAHATQRTKAFGRYSLIGALAGAVGALAAGVPEHLTQFGFTMLGAFKLMFLLYAGLGLAGGLAYRSIPAPPAPAHQERSAPLGPSKSIVYKLAALFSLDSFAGGFVVQSLLALWLFERFDLSLASAGLFFFWAGVLSAFSFPVAVWVARHVGLVNTMVFTHIPSSICLVLAAFAPNLELALALLLIRAALSQMDVPTRSSYVVAVVTPPERAAATSVTSVPRSLASAASPALSGAMFAAGLLAWPLVVCGALKIVYDLLLLAAFRHVKPPEEVPHTSAR